MKTRHLPDAMQSAVHTFAALLLAHLVLGCADAPDDYGPFSIKLAFDTSAEGQCTSTSCSDYGMSCSTVVSLRIRDLDNGGALVAENCEEIPASDSLCGLRDLLRPTYFNIPPHRLQIEVAAWRRDVVEPDLTVRARCPSGDLFDSEGRPRPTYSPPPAFAGAAEFNANSTDQVAEVPITCQHALQLDVAECSAPPLMNVEVSVDDIETADEATRDQAQNLTVSAAEPQPVPDGAGGNWFVIEADDTASLTLSDDAASATFAGSTRLPFDDLVCAVIVDLTPESTAQVTCETYDPAERPITLGGVLVTKSTLDPILAAMQLPAFPPQGLVVGRVIDDSGAPLADVQLTPSQGTVEYLSHDRSTLTGDRTSSNGMFVARDVPLGASWEAVHLGDGRREAGEVRAGLVNRLLTSVLVRMEP